MGFLLAAVLLLLLGGIGGPLATALRAVDGHIGAPSSARGLVATRLASRSGASPRAAKARCKTGSK